MGQYTIEEFLAKTSSLDRGEGRFELEQERTLKINLNGQVWIRTGATVTHTGQIQFRRERLLERGVRRLLKRALAGEGRPLTQAKGSGQLFLADQGKRISILHLQDDAVLVAGTDILAFEPEIDWDVELLRKLAGVLAGRSYGVRLQGRGLVAITTPYDPITLRVSLPQSAAIGPNALPWSRGLEPELP
jgi:uncharacterized protein (AIM24 family)